MVETAQRHADAEAAHVWWLTERPTLDPAGAVRPWSRTQARGFEHLEAAGLLLSLHAESLAGLGDSPAVRADGAGIVEPILRRLESGVVEHRGARRWSPIGAAPAWLA
ncbi:MAG: hypothetical protein KDA24_23490 [Deltaproteobacteria bacterium]|nr:hypothetical protein [Deltaproteobacteria bacterium]